MLLLYPSTLMCAQFHSSALVVRVVAYLRIKKVLSSLSDCSLDRSPDTTQPLRVKTCSLCPPILICLAKTFKALGSHGKENKEGRNRTQIQRRLANTTKTFQRKTTGSELARLGELYGALEVPSK